MNKKEAVGTVDNEYVKEYERVDDLYPGVLRIIQNPKEFCFGIDGVILADFAAKSVKKGAYVLDMGAGNGIITLLLTHKTEAARIVGLEIQESVAEMASRSLALNNIQNAEMVRGDLRQATEIFGKSVFDHIVCNPPYKEYGGGLISQNQSAAIARHEIMCTLRDVAEASAALLKPGGRLSIIHRPERLTDLLTLLREYGTEPKVLREVCSEYGKPPSMVLVEAVRGGAPKLFWEPPLFIYRPNGEYTDEINRIYERK